MDLQELAERTGIPIRRLRHCLDEDLIPGLKIEVAHNEAGRPRKFHDDVGFAICCAAKLLEAGIDRSTVRVFMGGLAKLALKNEESPALWILFNRRTNGIAELGDAINMRIRLELDDQVVDSGWVHPGNPATLSSDYRPMTIIALDVGQVGAQVFRWPKER
jgi:hypothetical protein